MIFFSPTILIWEKHAKEEKEEKKKFIQESNIIVVKECKHLSGVQGSGSFFIPFHLITPTNLLLNKKNTIKTLFCNLNIYCLAVIVEKI